ncbi:MAG: hypothetical protein P1V51_01700 [Deltaproteobacteria bacterium]|nr:hypothetical protein [Deltaproteobacteria bacterium]
MLKSLSALTLSLLLLAACGALSNLTTITLGDGEIPEFQIDREYPIGSQALEACPEGTRNITDQRTGDTLTVNITKTTGGCQMAFVQPQMVLFDEAEARQASAKLQGMQIEGLESAALLIKDFSLTDENDAAIDIETRLTSLSVNVDGADLFTREDILALSNGPVRKEISGALLQKMVDGVNNGTAVRADVAATVEFPDSAMQNLPGLLHVQTTLQPEVRLDVLEAAAGAAGG